MSRRRLAACSAADAAAIAELHRRCFADAWSAAAVGEMLGTAGSFGFVVAGEEEAEGFILCRAAAGECEVLALAVAPGRRRRGLARRLLAAALAQAGEAGAARMFLEVAADNRAARRFYRSFGFAEVGRRRHYYRRAAAPKVDALILARALGGG